MEHVHKHRGVFGRPLLFTWKAVSIRAGYSSKQQAEGTELKNSEKKQKFEERTPSQWANRYIGQLLDRLEAIVELPEIAKKDIRSTMHECAQSVSDSVHRRIKQEVVHAEVNPD